MPDTVMESFVSCFTRAAAIKPGKAFLAVGRDVLSYGDLLKRTSQLARIWAEAGLRTGDRVVLASRDDSELPLLFLALLRCGLTAVVIDPQLSAPAAQQLIRAADARGIILDRSLRQEWQPGGELYVLEIHKAGGRGATLFSKLLRRKESEGTLPGSYPAVLEQCRPGELPATLPDDLVAYILFTSGTTAQPKGVQITHANLAHHLGTLRRQFGYDSDCRILNVLPLHHADGLIQGPVAALWNGASVYRPISFSIPNIGLLLDAVYAERITHFVAVPTILALLLKFGREYAECLRTEDFRFVISAAAQLEADLWSQFEDTFRTRVVNIYGLTETVTGGLFSGPTDADHCVGTIGKPVDCEALIVDEAGKCVADDAPGELRIRGGQVMKGYLNNPAATAETLKDGWLCTGDIATRDLQGFYRIVGRKKNIIISGGLNIHPEEVSETLNTHPHVLESCAYGVADPIWGELLVAAVVPDGRVGISGAELIQYCRTRLVPAKIPHRIIILPNLPKGPSGKVIVDRVREMVARLECFAVVGEGNLRSRIVSIASRNFNVPAAELDPSSTADSTPGWDSLAHFGFLVELEETFNIRLTARELMTVVSLNEAERIVAEKYSGL